MTIVNGKPLDIRPPQKKAAPQLTWDKMKHLQPLLQDLEGSVRKARERLVSLHRLGIHRSPDTEWQDFDWDRIPIKESFEARMTRLVGFRCGVPELENSEAHNLAFRFLYGLLSGKKNWEGREWKTQRLAREKRQRRKSKC